MKINFILTAIALVTSALFAYLFYTLSDAGDKFLNVLAISGFLSTFIILEGGIGLSFKDKHHTVNSFATSLLFFCFSVVEHCCFAAWGTKQAWLIITTGLLLVLYFLVYYGISKTKM